jgi:hypothetical protein
MVTSYGLYVNDYASCLQLSVIMLVYGRQVVRCLVLVGLLGKWYLIRFECLFLFYLLVLRCSFTAELSFGYFPLSRSVFLNLCETSAR